MLGGECQSTSYEIHPSANFSTTYPTRTVLKWNPATEMRDRLLTALPIALNLKILIK
jgi:hypothetical protein